jgi:hypothetical protein
MAYNNLSYINDPLSYRCAVCGIGFELEWVIRLECGHYAHNKCYKFQEIPKCNFQHINQKNPPKSILKKNSKVDSFNLGPNQMPINKNLNRVKFDNF